MPGPSPDLTRVGVYERVLPVSTARVWENVRDWEHLPWLHAGSFEHIALEESGRWGWRARIGLERGDEIRLELVLDEDRPRYVSRTLEGSGQGSEIWTEVEARGDDETGVRVEFFVPGSPSGAVAEQMGRGYVELYRQLWDEDEAMMRTRARALASKSASAPATAADRGAVVSLGSIEELRARLPFDLRFEGRPFRVVEEQGRLLAYSLVCPHWLGPLDDAAIEDGRVRCPWHGYRFDIGSGRECSGRRLRLAPPPRVQVDPENGQVWLDRAP